MEFPGIPFSGWYMGTEIARDLGDANRYNMLKVSPTVASVMDGSTDDIGTYWYHV